jgi:putative ABC transport system permease protein
VALSHDLRYGVRLLYRQPAFSVVVILTLALGIGLNSAVFSVANAALLRPLSYPSAERLVWLGTHGGPIGASNEVVLSTDFVVWREQATSFDLMVGYEPNSMYSLVARDIALQARAVWVSYDFWALSGARIALGRLPTAGERQVVVLTDDGFVKRFQRDPAVVGTSVMLDGQQVTIVGVLPADFRFELPAASIDQARQVRDIDMYRTIVPAPQERSRGTFLYVVGRLKPDASIDRARTEIEAIRARIVQTSPMPFIDRNVLTVAPLHDRVTGNARRALWILLAAVGFVLLIACTNIASLLLARSSARQRESAIRASLGASRGRLLGQSMAESAVLAFAGGAAGLLLAYWGLAVIVRLTPHALPRLTEARIDGRVIAFSLLASLLTACLFTLGPAVSQWRANFLAVLRSGGWSVSPSRNHVRTRRVLVATELALAVVLLTGAGLMIKSFWRMNEHPPGFEPDRILSFTVPLSGPRYRDLAERRRFADEVVSRMQSTQHDAFGLSTGNDMIAFVLKEGAPPPRPDQPRRPASLNATSAGYAKAMGLRLIKGRWITDNEPEPVFVINEAVARRDFNGEDPVGRRIQLPRGPGGGRPGEPSFATIVGVVSDVKYLKLDADPEPEVYIPYRHHPGLFRFTVLVRMAGDPLAAMPGFQRMLGDIDPTQALFDVTTLEDALAASITPRRFILMLLGTFAAAAVILAMIGIYGVIAYIVTLRTHEIGVRMALGAERRTVVRLVVQQGLGMIFAGLAVGVVAALGLTRFMASVLYGVEPTDPLTFTLVAVTLGIAALVACGAPALKAARVDPLVSLRYE